MANKIKILSDAIEPIEAHVKYTLGITDTNKRWRYVGEILWGIDDHEITPGLKDIANKFKPLVELADQIEFIGADNHVVDKK